MPRDQRYVPPGTLLEVTTRCYRNQMLLTPTPEVRDTLIGVLGRALSLFPGIELHGFIFLSNHYHLLLTASDPETLSRFMCFLNGNIARKVSKLIGHTGRFWSRRYADIPVVDDDAQIPRARYLLENGCKEHLVASPLDWPGPTSARALVHGERLRGTWVNETELSRARRRGETVSRADFTSRVEIELSPLPTWKSLSEKERRSRYLTLVREIEIEHQGSPVIGAERVVSQDPFSVPLHSSRSPEPRCHASTLELWVIYCRGHRDLLETYQRASARIRRGELTPSAIPAFTLPPPLHWNPDRNLRRGVSSHAQASAH